MSLPYKPWGLPIWICRSVPGGACHFSRRFERALTIAFFSLVGSSNEPVMISSFPFFFSDYAGEPSRRNAIFAFVFDFFFLCC